MFPPSGDEVDGDGDEPSDEPNGSADVSLTEAADLLGVHYMTAYRYVRIGKLPARKVGRGWRVDRAELEALRSAEPTASSAATMAERSRRLTERLIAFDERGAWNLIEAALASGADPIRVHIELVTPTLRELGERWLAGELTVAEEHGATTICRSLVGRISLMSSRPGISKGTIVFGCAPGDDHTLAATVAADIFRASGFDVIDCGGDLPVRSFADLVAAVERLAAVGISVTMPGETEAVRAMVAEIRSRRPDAMVLLGGAAAVEVSEAIGADLAVATALEGVELLTAG